MIQLLMAYAAAVLIAQFAVLVFVFMRLDRAIERLEHMQPVAGISPATLGVTPELVKKHKKIQDDALAAMDPDFQDPDFEVVDDLTPAQKEAINIITRPEVLKSMKPVNIDKATEDAKEYLEIKDFPGPDEKIVPFESPFVKPKLHNMTVQYYTIQEGREWIKPVRELIAKYNPGTLHKDLHDFCEENHYAAIAMLNGHVFDNVLYKRPKDRCLAYDINIKRHPDYNEEAQK